jgi:hypothetical protein
MTSSPPSKVNNVIVVHLTFNLVQPSFPLQIKLRTKALSWVLIAGVDSNTSLCTELLPKELE